MDRRNMPGRDTAHERPINLPERLDGSPAVWYEGGAVGVDAAATIPLRSSVGRVGPLVPKDPPTENECVQFTVLGSGSAGNVVLVQTERTRILIEAGLSLRETRRRAQTLDLELDRVDGVFLTHEHADHAAHASAVSRGLGASLFLNRGTEEAAARYLTGDCAVRRFETGEVITLGDLSIETHRKPHDAADPVTFLVSHRDCTLGVFTDLGHVDPLNSRLLARCTALVLEANHDPALLEAGPYPVALKRRVSGSLGHLCNEDSARALAIAAPSLATLVLAHLSETNNHPRLVKEAFLRHGGDQPGYLRWISFQERATPLLRTTGEVSRRPLIGTARVP